MRGSYRSKGQAFSSICENGQSHGLDVDGDEAYGREAPEGAGDAEQHEHRVRNHVEAEDVKHVEADDQHGARGRERQPEVPRAFVVQLGDGHRAP